jgi:hypothetical protein
VIGAVGLVESAKLTVVGDPTAASYLWLKTHRLNWREDGEFATTDQPVNSVRSGSKGSVRLNGGAWVAMTNATVSCERHEAEMGCMNGAYMSLRLRVAMSKLGLPGLRVGENTLEFRFDATDGVSSGWRVLGIDFRNANGQSLIANNFTWDDPDTWTPPLNTDADIKAGRALWSSAALTDLNFTPSTRSAIRGKCASCHVSDGEDLAYFNYSNKSIIARSVFHGLSELQGKQIASYIRSLDLKLPQGYTRKSAGRPWNPPYQPGPGLDSKPVELWAAGAGLDAVLDRDRDMKNYFFPGGQYKAEIMGANGFLNPRETPQAMQYPDWNAWLPTIAVEDLVADPSQLSGSPTMKAFKQASDALDAYKRSPNDQTLGSAFWYRRQFLETRNRHAFPTEYWFTDRDQPAPPRTVALSIKQTRHNLAKVAWYNVRQFELNRKYGLEDKTRQSWAAGAPQVSAGFRSWGETARTMFETAPHFVADHAALTFNFTQAGNYLSTAWYSLEQIINGGYKAGAFGIDWNYHPGHIAGMARTAPNAPYHAYRMAWALIWMYQSIPLQDWRTTPPVPWTPQSFGFSQRQFGQGLDLVYGSAELEARGDITRAERAQLQESMALAFLGVAERYRPEQWVRRVADDDAHRSADNFETANYVAHFVPNHVEGWCEWGYQADCYYERIKNLKESGLVAPTTLTRLVNWAAGVWPKGEWAKLR